MAKNILTVGEQRAKRGLQAALSVSLYISLKHLMREIISSDKFDFQKLAEFKDLLQYAPPEMKSELMTALDQRRLS